VVVLQEINSSTVYGQHDFKSFDYKTTVFITEGQKYKIINLGKTFLQFYPDKSTKHITLIQ